MARLLRTLRDGAVAARLSRSSEWHLLRRYQLWLLYGGGGLITLAIFVAVGITVAARLDAYISDQQQAFVTGYNSLANEMITAQSRMRRTVHAAEMNWKQPGNIASAATLRSMERQLMRSQGQLLIDGFDGILPVQIFYLGADRKAARPGAQTQPQASAQAATRRHYLGLTLHMALQRTLSEMVHDYKLAGYFFDPGGDFVAAYPPPPASQTGHPTAASNERKLRHFIEYIGAHVPQSANRSEGAGAPSYLREVFWLGPHPDVLTGTQVVSYAGVAYDNREPFAIFVNNITLGFLRGKIDDAGHNGTFFVVPDDGTPLISSSVEAAAAQRMLPSVLAMQAQHGGASVPALTRRDGVFMFSQTLPGTRWLAVYAFDWRSVMTRLRHELTLVAVSGLAVLALLWGFLLCFNHWVFRPVHRRSRRVYESEQFNRAVIEMAPVGLSVLSFDRGSVLLQNDVMRAFALDLRSDGGSPLPNRLLDAYLEAKQTGRNSLEKDIGHTRRDGSQIHLRIAIVKTRYQGRNVLLCAAIDISARKQLEEKLQQARRLSDQANRAKSAFLANMSHEIRTPMHGMLGHLELLALSPLDHAQAERVEIVRASSQHLLQTINDILDLSKLESDYIRLESAVIDAAGIVETVALNFAPSAAKKHIALHCLIDPDVPASLVGDGARLAQIVTNLVNNAIKFTETGSIIIRLHARDVSGGRQWLRIEVEDTGIGIDSENQGKLFEPFMQADDTISRRFGGTGLGLSLCKRFTQLMGGTIGVTSRPGAGSTFSVTLPLGIANALSSHDSLQANDVSQDLPQGLPLQGQPVAVLATHAESARTLSRRLQALGASTIIIAESTEGLPPALLSDGGLLIALSAPVDAVDRWIAAHMPDTDMRWIDVTPDGPLSPRRQGRAWQVSSYSRASLLLAIQMARAPRTVVENTVSARRLEPDDILPVSHATSRSRILVVEDHAVNLQLLAEQLERLGYASVGARHGDEALAQFARGGIDLVLTDISMPEIDGYQLAAMLRRQGATLPILAITANAGQDEAERCRQAGIDDVLVKPSTLAQLRRTVSKWLGAGVPPKPPAESTNTDVVERLATDDVMRALLVQTMQEDLAVLRRAMATNDLDTAAVKVHRIKGACATVKADAIVQSCLRIESHLRAGDDPAIAAAWANLQGDIERFIAHWSGAGQPREAG